MIPVFQSTVDQGRGDCQRAAIASLFDLELSQVPHFRLYPQGKWFQVYWHFLLGLGYEYKGCAGAERHKDRRNYEGINGFFYAVVKSKTFKDCTHSVIIDEAGIVVHDPNPNGLYQGINVIETGDLRDVHIIEKRGERE